MAARSGPSAPSFAKTSTRHDVRFLTGRSSMSLPLVETIQQLALAAGETPAMSFDLVSMWHSMGFFAKFIAAVLAIMSIYSLGVMAERLVTYARASSASRQ